MSQFTVLDPRADTKVQITPYALSCDSTAQGLRVGLLSNCFFDASNLLNSLGEALNDLLVSPVITLYESPNASVTASAELIAEVASKSDVGVAALGHCGSCTSSATRNAVNLAREGLPTCVLISEKFMEAGSFVARSVGMPDIPRVQLPHPVSGTGSLRIKEIARDTAPSVISAWQRSYANAA